MRHLIRFDDAQKAVCDGCAKQFATLPCESSDCQIQETLSHVLPIDAAPVRRGEWKHTKHDEYVACSHCGQYRNIYTQGAWNFCPNCGADMRTARDPVNGEWREGE